MTERSIQRNIVRTLRQRGYVVHASTPPQASVIARRVAKDDGHLTGWPDLIVVGTSRIVFLEVKTGEGRISPAQERIHATLRDYGWTVGVVRSVSEALDAVHGSPHLRRCE